MNKEIAQWHLRTVQSVGIPIWLWLCCCVSLGKLLHFSGLQVSHFKSGLRGPTREDDSEVSSAHQCSLAHNRRIINLPVQLGTWNSEISMDPFRIPTSWTFLFCLRHIWVSEYSATRRYTASIPFDQILGFLRVMNSQPHHERKAFCEPHHMKNKSSKWVTKENVFPGRPGEEHFRVERGASVWGLRVLSAQPRRRSHSPRETDGGKGRKPEVGLSFLDERLFSVLTHSLWWGPWLARGQYCRQEGWPHWKRQRQASLGLRQMTLWFD